MSDDESPFLELSIATSTGDDLVDYFHLDSHRSLNGRICHNIGRETESWRRDRRPLGHGGFGTAWLERNNGGGMRVIKEVKKVIPGVGTNYSFRELQALALLSKNKEHFPQFYGWFQDLDYISIAMEHFRHGDLTQCVHEALPEDQGQMITLQVSQALKYMHSKHIAHRDLKPANILVRQPSPSWHVVIADFGVSKRVRGVTTALHTSFEGDFMAPEILGFIGDDTLGEYTNAVDTWSLGCLAYWLLHCTIPVQRRNMREHCTLPWSLAAAGIDMRSASADAKGFILSLLTPLPDDRMSAAQACKHHWLSMDTGGSTTDNSPIPTSTLPKEQIQERMHEKAIRSQEDADRERSAQDISFERDYVVVEKRRVHI